MMPNRPHNIKAIIFDFGGVLMRTDDPEPRERIAEQLGLSTRELEAIVFESEDSQRAEVGAITSEERWKRVMSKLGLSAPDAWQTFPSQFFAGEVLDMELVEYVRHLHETHKTALLSNASDSLDHYVRNTLELDDAFDVIIISALVGVSKPDPAIYRLALDRLQVAAHEAIFVDDRWENVEAAATVGIHAIQFSTSEALMAQIDHLLGRVSGATGGTA
jgi:epoxide hydrolase-like predicted phosphatase